MIAQWSDKSTGKTKDDDIIALDSKVSFDENAEFRHKNWDELRDLSEEGGGKPC